MTGATNGQISNATAPFSSGGGGVTSINGETGAVTLTSTGATITITPSGSTINLETAGGGGGAPTNATYITLTNNGSLTDNRTLAVSTALSITDGGATGPITIGTQAITGDVAIPANGTTSTIQANAVTTSKINNTAVTYAKLQNESAVTLLGNPTGSPTSPSEITLGSGLSFSGTTLVATGSGGTVTSVSGTTNRITSTGGTTPVIDISASYVGQSSITTLGTVATGTWQGTKVGLLYGGTNADLSGTGGTSQVLKQVSAGAAVTVAQLAFTDISGTTTTAQLPANQIIRCPTATANGNGSVVTTGAFIEITIGYSGTITNWSVSADQTGSIVIDIKRSGTSIIGGGNSPTLSSQKNATAAVSGWTSTAITAGDVLAYSVTSASTLLRAVLTLTVNAT